MTTRKEDARFSRKSLRNRVGSRVDTNSGHKETGAGSTEIFPAASACGERKWVCVLKTGCPPRSPRGKAAYRTSTIEESSVRTALNLGQTRLYFPTLLCASTCLAPCREAIRRASPTAFFRVSYSPFTPNRETICQLFPEDVTKTVNPPSFHSTP